jgi:hypothetical protein
LVQRKASARLAGVYVDLDEQCVPGQRNVRRPCIAEQVAQRIPDDGEERDELLARRALGIV